MTITESESASTAGSLNDGQIHKNQTVFNTRIEPEISLEWTDLKIEIKYCGSDIPEEDLEYVELFPNLSDKVLSSACLLEKKQEYRRRQKDQNSNRPGSRTAHTLTEVLEQNEKVNHKRRSDGGSEFMSPEPEEDEDSKSQKSEDLDLPENIDQLIDIKMLITLEDGSKKCHICGKEFSDTTRMKRHLLSHSDKKPFKCNLCGWGFHQKTNMERHLASHTNEGEGHPCSYCNSWFTTKSVLSLHIREAHNGRITTKPKYEDDDTDFSPHTERKVKDVFAEDCDLSNLKCNICGKTFVKKTNLKHHLMLHRGEKPWKCHICGWRFVQKCNLKKHIETHNTGMYHCPHCNVKFASKGAVNGHLALAHADKATPYLNVDATSNQEDDEEAEIPAPEGDSVRKIKTETPLPSNTWWKSTDDQTVESKTVVSQQFQAGSITITPKTVSISPQTSSPKLEQILKTFSCTNCPKVFSSKKDLDNHTLVHNAGMKPFACPVCGLRFHLLHNMKRHLQTHEESGDIEVGTASGLLEAVEATATKVQNNMNTSQSPGSTVTTNAAGHMKCHFCNKWFSEQAALQRHMEVHSANRPYSCPICGWRFKQMHNMKRHLLTHSGAKPYSCDFCDKSYTDNYSLKQHVAKIHPDIASSLPHMMITPRNKNKPTAITPKKDEEGFKSMVNEMTASQKAAALQAYQNSLRIQQEEDLPFGVEAVTYDEDEDEDMEDTGLDPTEFMEEGNLEIDTDDEQGDDAIVMNEDPVVREDHIEIEQPPVTEEVIDQGGEADDEKESEKEKESELKLD